MRIAAASDIGLVRTRNEDVYWFDIDRNIFVLADGLGGHKAGEVAAALAVKIVAERISLAVDEGLGSEDLAPTLQDAFSVASEEVFSRAQESEALSGMGCSLIAGVLQNHLCFVAHVGDSRAYLFFNDKLSQITVDDTPVAAMIKRGYLLPEKAKSHSLKNVLMKSVGTKRGIDANVSEFPVKPGERILVCSDGLWGMVDRTRICAILSRNQDVQIACLDLVEEARARGGTDNITVMLIEVE